MIEYVFRPSRRVSGKRVLSRIYCGRYSLRRGEKPVTVSLDTPDERVARKRLRDIVVQAQREQEGLIAPAAVRVAAAAPLTELLADYRRDLVARELAPKHVHDTTTRLQRVLTEIGWKKLFDVRGDSFVQWRASLACSAKTKKEYQVSMNAFLNWLVKTDQLPKNPLSKIDRVDIRGKQERKSRAYTQEELRRLFSVAGERALAYQMLLYTGQRVAEISALVWADLHLDKTQPYMLVREGTTKDKDKRAVPLHPDLASRLMATRAARINAGSNDKIFSRFPKYDTLREDLVRAKIPHTDELGRVVHRHAFRKTWQTFGVQFGINQRSAQEVLGHSDANLTAKVYTDVPALGLHAEIAKLPWITKNAQPNAQNASEKPNLNRFREILAELMELSKTACASAFASETKNATPEGVAFKLGAGAGFEPATFRL